MKLRGRFFVEAGAAGVSAIMVILTLLWPDWIERIFEVAPDEGGGGLEWSIVVVAGSIMAVLSVLARMEWLRTQRLAEEAKKWLRT